MTIKLTPSYYLTDELEDAPTVVKRITGAHYGPNDIVQWYPSWGLQPCRQSVRRAAAVLTLNSEQSELVAKFIGPGRPSNEPQPATGHIHLRVTMERKNRYVKAAKKAGLGLSEWLTATCDKESA